MPEIRQRNAIRTRIFLGGKFITRDPLPIQITPKRFEKKTLTSNLAMRVDRCFTMAGMPNVRNRREFTLPWSDLREPGMLEHLDVLTAIGQPFSFGLWKQETDVFDGDGVNKVFYLQRRQLLHGPEAVTPPIVWEDYPTRVIVLDKSYLDPTATATEITPAQKTGAEMVAGNPGAGEAWINKEGNQFGNLWTSELRFGTAPVNATDNVVAIYLPLYQVLVDSEAPRSYAQSLVEPRTLKISEFG